MSKQYNTKLQERLEKFLKDENLSQAKAAPILGISQAALSQYRRSMYDKGDIEAVENKLKEFFQIQEEKTQNAQKAEPFRTKTSAGYIPTTISEEAYKLIRYCQLEKGIVVIDGDAGIGKTKAAAKFLQDNPSTTVYVKATPSTGSTRSLVKFFPVLEEKGMQKEIDYLLSISHSKWGIRGMVSVFNNAVNNEDISFEGLEKMANTMGIRFI